VGSNGAEAIDKDKRTGQWCVGKLPQRVEKHTRGGTLR